MFNLLKSRVCFAKGKLYLKQKSFAKAASSFEKAYSFDNSRKVAIYWQARALAHAHRDDEALKEINRYISSDPRDDTFLAAAFALLGNIYRRRDDFESALSWHERAVNLHPEAQYVNAAGMAALNCRQWSKAKEYFERVLATVPGFYESVRGLADAELRLGHNDEAEKRIRWCIDNNPGNVDGHAFLGNILFAKGEYRKAENEFSAAVRLSPNNVYSITALGCCHGKLGAHEDAMRCFSRCIALEPENARHRYFAAEASFWLKWFPEAIEHSRYARRLDAEGNYYTGDKYQYTKYYALSLQQCGFEAEAKAELDALAAAEAENTN
jgi:tetratricopeptide (TPR) repeat protein